MPYEEIHEGQMFLLRKLAPDEGVLGSTEDPLGTDWSGFVREPYHGGPDHGGTIEQDPSVAIHWSKGENGRDGHVQIELSVTPSWLRKRLADMERDGSPEPYRIGLFTDVIPRRALNKMRTVLERARDQAFGADA